MKTFNVPYAKGFVDINIPNQNIAGVLESKTHSYKAELSQEALVEHALDNPIGSQRLEELVKGKSNMVIITSDHTRPVPSKITMPILLRRIREANPSIDITILGSIINVGVTPLRCHFQHYFFALNCQVKCNSTE